MSLFIRLAGLLTAIVGCAAARGAPLNEGGPPPAAGKDARPLAERLRLAALRVKSAYSDGSTVDYGALARSPEFEDLARTASELRSFDLKSLASPAEKIAFWTNVYNSLVVHAVVELRKPSEGKAEGAIKSVRDVSGFFDKTSYVVGGLVFSLSAIENGVLRANRRAPYHLFAPFGPSDPRLAHALKDDEFDPRVHFALNCGSRSCPPFAFLKAEGLDRQLETAARGFINSDSEVRDGEIWISKIFDWYERDFQPNVRDFLRARAEGPLKAALDGSKARIRYSDYDWSLNQTPSPGGGR